MRGRLTVGHGTLNPGMKVRSLPPQLFTQYVFYCILKQYRSLRKGEFRMKILAELQKFWSALKRLTKNIDRKISKHLIALEEANRLRCQHDLEVIDRRLSEDDLARADYAIAMGMAYQGKAAFYRARAVSRCTTSTIQRS